MRARAFWQTRRRVPALVASALILFVLTAPGQTPLGTAFTYQGRLIDNNTAANGSYDFQFILYNAPAGGAQVGPIIVVDDQTVAGGIFTAALDFGAAAFAGDARWLEVGVRPGASAGVFGVLSPRQQLTPTPGAVFAQTAATAITAGGYTGNLLRVETVSNSSNPVLELKDNSPGQLREAAINFVQTNDTVRGQIAYHNPDGPMTFRVANSTRMTIDSAGGTGITGPIRAGSTTVNAWSHFGSGGSPTVSDISNINDVYIFGDLQAGGLLYAGGALVAGDSTPTANQAFSSFGSGTKDEAAVSSADDVYVSGELEVDGTIHVGAAMNVPDAFAINVAGNPADLVIAGTNATLQVPDNFTINVGGNPANLTITGANALTQIGDSAADKVGIGRAPTQNALEVNGNASKTIAGDWLANSDRRLKKDIQNVGGAVEVINKLRPVKFRYNEEFLKRHPGTRDVYYYNYIAQEFQDVFPDSVQDDGEGYLQLDTHNAQVYSVAAIQELHQALKQKDGQIAELEEQVRALRNTLNDRVAALEQAVHSRAGSRLVKADR